MSDFVTGHATPGTIGTEYNTLAFVFGQLLQKIQTVSLVEVLSCTNDGELSPVGRVSVQPLVFQVSGSGTITPHGEISDLPYMRLQGGDNAVIIDPKPGDIGIALFCSRDIANVKADPQAAVAAGGATPGSFGTFDWADGLYVGGVLNGNPTQYIRFSSSGIEIVSPTKITLRAPTVEVDASALFKVVTDTSEIDATTLFKVAAGAVDIEATGDAKLAGSTVEVSGATTSVSATGTATVSGAAIVLAGPVSQTGGGTASFSGSINTTTGDVTAQGTSLHTHVHGPGTYVAGPTSVTGNSAPP